MPIYEFACQDCGYEFEKIQSFSDSSTPVCPNCQGLHVQRRLSAPAIHFKGSGWYITDSKNAAKKSATGAGSEGDGGKGKGESESNGEGKGESGKGDSSKSESGKGDSSKGDSSKGDAVKGESSGSAAKNDAPAAAAAKTAD